MSSKEYHELKKLQYSEGYKILEALWLHQVSTIEDSRDKAAKRSGESAWRYFAGQEKGFKLAMTALTRALLQMEKEEGEISEEQPSEVIEKLLNEIRPTNGETK